MQIPNTSLVEEYASDDKDPVLALTCGNRQRTKQKYRIEKKKVSSLLIKNSLFFYSGVENEAESVPLLRCPKPNLTNGNSRIPNPSEQAQIKSDPIARRASGSKLRRSSHDELKNDSSKTSSLFLC